jgi:hypothetical protein
LHRLLSNKNIRIPTPKKLGTPPTPRTIRFFGGKGGYFEKLSKGFETSDMTLEGLGEVFKGDSADMCADGETSERSSVRRRRKREIFLNLNDNYLEIVHLLKGVPYVARLKQHMVVFIF